MCIICVEYQKGLLTAGEALRNMGEMAIEPEHREEINRMIEDRELVEKITTAPARYAFKVDVGSVPPEKAEAYLREVKSRMRSNPPNPTDQCE